MNRFNAILVNLVLSVVDKNLSETVSCTVKNPSASSTDRLKVLPSSLPLFAHLRVAPVPSFAVVLGLNTATAHFWAKKKKPHRLLGKDLITKIFRKIHKLCNF